MHANVSEKIAFFIATSLCPTAVEKKREESK
jgi:hypothetical protein